jgi:hypothetical protein
LGAINISIVALDRADPESLCPDVYLARASTIEHGFAHIQCPEASCILGPTTLRKCLLALTIAIYLAVGSLELSRSYPDNFGVRLRQLYESLECNSVLREPSLDSGV